jgi:hypothetical protein
LKNITESPLRRGQGGAVLSSDDHRFDEFVGHSGVVRRFDCGAGISEFPPLAAGDCVVGAFDAFPAVVSIHRVVAAGDCGDAPDADFAHFRHQFLDVALARFGRRVASIGEGVNEDAPDAALRRHLQERVKMPDPRMHAAVRH